MAIVTWPDVPEVERQDEHDGLHWKTRRVVAWAAGRPFIWLDDEMSQSAN